MISGDVDRQSWDQRFRSHQVYPAISSNITFQETSKNSYKWDEIFPINGLSMVFTGNDGIFHAPKNGWLEDDPASFWGMDDLFSELPGN